MKKLSMKIESQTRQKESYEKDLYCLLGTGLCYLVTKAAFTFIYILVLYILRSNAFFYCVMTIYIPFTLFKSNRV